MAIPVPTVDDVSIDQLYKNPYPIFKKLRREAPIAWVPAAQINLVTSYDFIAHMDTHPEDFPAYDRSSLQIKAMGHTMMRKDFDDHRSERMAVQKAVSPKLVYSYWKPRFEWIIEDVVNQFKGRGEADLFQAFAKSTIRFCQGN